MDLNLPEFFATLRQDTARLLGFAGVEGLSATAGLKVDLASSLRLEIDRMQAAQLRGEAADLRVLVVAGEMLECLLRPTEIVQQVQRSTDSRDRLKALIDATIRAGPATDPSVPTPEARVAELEAEVEQLRAELEVARAAPPPAAPSADVVPLRPAPPPRTLTAAESAARLERMMTAPRSEEWRPYVDANGIRTTAPFAPPGGPPRGW